MLRIGVYYYDANQCPRAGVPPESIWVQTSIQAGNLKVNDLGLNTYADDTTDAQGFARITLRSFSGCGKVGVKLIVSGVIQGTKYASVRTTDPDGDGRMEAAEGAPVCDLDYSDTLGTGDLLDQQIAIPHIDHWHRNALFGTPVRRTNLSHAEGGHGAIGESQLFWSPSGRWLSYTIHGPSAYTCHVFIVPSSPSIGDQPKQFTWLPDSSDYDPTWSPLNTEIAFGRADYRIMRKGVPGLNPDTTEKLVAQSGRFQTHGDLTPAFSPNGQWVAFGRLDTTTLDYHIWKVPTAGGTATQLTFTPGVADQYPNWSPDGNWIAFDREIGFPNPHHAYKVKANQSAPQDTTTYRIYSAGADRDAATPAFSPDELIVTVGVGTHSESILDVVTHTLDPALATPKPVANYPDTAFAIHGPHPVLSPKISPDGTRLALRSRQIWATRRNMNLPPRFTSVTGASGSQAIGDTTATMSVVVPCPGPGTVTVSASDPEGDALTYHAGSLLPWMTWNGTALSVTPHSGLCGNDYYVNFWVTTESGGTDSFIAIIKPRIQAGPDTAQVILKPGSRLLAVATPVVPGRTATLGIFDLSGRRVALLRGHSGSQLVWDGRDRVGKLAAPGIYLYRMEAGKYRKDGRIVVLR